MCRVDCPEAANLSGFGLRQSELTSRRKDGLRLIFKLPTILSPPELVLKAEKATLTRLSPLQDEVKLTRPRLVFDQNFSLPFLFSRTVLDRRQRDAAPFRFAYDAQDRGGLYLEGVFNVLQTQKVSLTLFPQIFIQRIIDNRQGGISLGNLSNYGLRTRLDAELSPSTFLRGSAELTSFDAAQFEDSLRASVRVRQILATPIGSSYFGV